MPVYHTCAEAPDHAPTSVLRVDLDDVKLLNLLGHLRETATQLDDAGPIPGALLHRGSLAELSWYIEGYGVHPTEVKSADCSDAALCSEWVKGEPPEGTPARIDAMRICADEAGVWWTWYDHYTDDGFHAVRRTSKLAWNTVFPEGG